MTTIKNKKAKLTAEITFPNVKSIGFLPIQVHYFTSSE